MGCNDIFIPLRIEESNPDYSIRKILLLDSIRMRLKISRLIYLNHFINQGNAKRTNIIWSVSALLLHHFVPRIFLQCTAIIGNFVFNIVIKKIGYDYSVSNVAPWSYFHLFIAISFRFSNWLNFFNSNLTVILSDTCQIFPFLNKFPTG